MSREDRELLAELSRLNTAKAPQPEDSDDGKAIMERGKVNELIQTLELAREDANEELA